MWVGGQSDLFSENEFSRRIRLASVIFAIFYGIITLRLFYLQVLQGERLSALSESNRTQILFLRAPRGDFYDKKGVKMVTNRPSWSLMYSPPEELRMDRKVIENRLQPYLEDFPDRWRSRLYQSFSSGKMVRLAEDVPSEISFALREMGELLPGLRVVMEFRRGYPQGFVAGHLLGYLSEIDENELKQAYWQPRKPGDLIGKMGLEKEFDNELRGRDGGMVIEVDSVGRLTRVIKQLQSQKGSSIKLALDHDVQAVAEEELAKTSSKRGAVVVLDTKTGAVRAWVSAPTFDPSGSLQEDLLNPNKPFFDRVHKGVYPPGSVFKIVTAIAGFKEKAIRLKDEIYCPGYVMLKDRWGNSRRYGCWTNHGQVDFWKSLRESCDAYYYLLSEKIGSEAITQTSRDFGLGQVVQDMIPGEKSGLIPSPAWKRKRGLGGWSTGDSYNMSIGQGYVAITPLQAAVLMMGVANRGTVYKPFVVEHLQDNNGNVLRRSTPEVLRINPLDDFIWSTIHRALKMVVDHGTGRAASIPYLDVYGKTGTAQNPHGKDHAWFGAFAGYPGEEPSLALIVFVENGGNGSSVAAPIARKLLEVALPPPEGPPEI